MAQYEKPRLNRSLVGEFILSGLSENPDLQIFLFGLFTVVYIVTLGGNFIIITLIRSDHRLHRPMYFFLEHLSFLDVSLTTVIVPKMLDNLIKNRKSISFAACITQIHFYQVFIVSECYVLAFMAYDRYLAICQPFRYPTLMSRKALVLLAASCWTMGLTYSFVKTTLMLKLVFCGPNIIESFFCDGPPLFQLSCSDTSSLDLFQFAAGLFIGPFPALVVVGSYIPIICTILKIKSDGARKKTFSTCASHVMVVTLFYGSGIFTYVIQPQLGKEWRTSHVVILTYTVIAPMLNPFIYSLRNQDVHQALSRLFHQTKV